MINYNDAIIINSKSELLNYIKIPKASNKILLIYHNFPDKKFCKQIIKINDNLCYLQEIIFFNININLLTTYNYNDYEIYEENIYDKLSVFNNNDYNDKQFILFFL